MVAIGVGGADAVDVMVGMPWELKFPKIIGIKLTGNLSGWASPKDVILKVAGILTVKGGTGAILEYFGEGAQALSCTGKGTICNMGAEIGATTSLFGYDESMARYLNATGRNKVSKLADTCKEHLTGDMQVYAEPQKYFDQVIEIDLSQLEPHINGPFTPDLAWPLSKFAQAVKENNYPTKMEVGLIGSCTNSSYEDLDRAASLALQAKKKDLNVHAEFIITPGSEQIRATIERDGQLKAFQDIGGVVMSNACGPCIGQWSRHTNDPKRKNSIMTSFNRNFAKRNDGNAQTHAFVASPEIVTAFAIAGDLTFNPLTDSLLNKNGEKVKLAPPQGSELPSHGFIDDTFGYTAPAQDGNKVNIAIDKNSDRLQVLEPFTAWNGKNLLNMKLLIKAQGKCTTDHISMAGPWLKYRGHLENISKNLLIGATNAFTGDIGKSLNPLNNEMMSIPDLGLAYKKAGHQSIIIGDENYGEGSSREHAAMEPRFLGVIAVIVKSFARIHETNLKKQGLLALTFKNKEDYNLIEAQDSFDLMGLENFTPSSKLTLVLHHADKTVHTIELNHTYAEGQILWFKAGSALNLIRAKAKV